MVNNLDNNINNNNNNNNLINNDDKQIIVYIFSGIGSQYNSMCKELYDTELIFKESMDEIDIIFNKLFGYSILNKLRSIKDDDIESINHPTISQPSTLMIQISLFKLLKFKYNINPSFLIGHSFGEMSVSYCSGMINNLETICLITYYRSIAQIKLIGKSGLMAIGIGEQVFNQNYKKQIQFENLEIASYNSENSIVVGGSKDTLNSFELKLHENDIFAVQLGSSSAYHTSYQDIIKDELIENFKNCNFENSTNNNNNKIIPSFSTVTSTLFNNTSNVFNGEYIFKNIRQPILFTKTISNLYKHIQDKQLGKNITFIELAPQPILSLYYLKDMIPKNNQFNVTILTTFNKNKSDIDQIKNVVNVISNQQR